jgi:hypothetical protein
MTELSSLPENSPVPTLLAFLICESVIHDAETQKKTLVGLFDNFLSSAVPCLIAGLGLYAKLVEGSGQYIFKIRLVNLKDESQLLELSTPGNWPVAEAPLEFGVNIRGIPVQAFGSYEFQLYANDVYLGRAVFRVEKLQLPQLPFPPPGTER